MSSHDPFSFKNESVPLTVFWFRRDLRVDDNHGLYQALASGRPVLPLFIFDSEILAKLPRDDARVSFIHQQLEVIRARCVEAGSDLVVEMGRPLEVWTRLFVQLQIQEIHCNEDYEPYARARDAEVESLAQSRGVRFYRHKDQVIFGPNEVVKEDGQPYRVYTPYSKKWLSCISAKSFDSFPSEDHLPKLVQGRAREILALAKIGFTPSSVSIPPATVSKVTLENYGARRDQMGEAGTSRLGLHLRFGTGSVRKLARAAHSLSPIFLRELIWREFFMQILWHFPQTVSEPFDSRYIRIEWRNDKTDFEHWCAGRTGYPVVDAGLRELQATGFMHNRARMIVGSFLTKHLLIDWRWGERFFAEKLLDFELSANVGNWQWVAGCGCDAAPYFRVFNPELQAKKFDPKGDYVRKWVPEWGQSSYPRPMVEHDFARRRALATFQAALKPKP